MWSSNATSSTSFTMRRSAVFILLLAEAHSLLSGLRRQENRNEGKSQEVLIRSKRRWVLSTFELDEEAEGPFPQIFTQLHNDQHLGTSHRFRISGQGVSTDPKGVFSINDKTGVIFILKPIDRELYPALKVQFDVLDENNSLLDKTLAFDVIIRDKNDNPPLFTPDILNIKIPENIKEGLLPFSLHASDKDQLENNNSRISLRIVSQNPPLPKVYIDSFSAVQNTITATFAFTGCFDFDKSKVYKILVEARDQGRPTQSSTATINLIITDSNTHKPVLNSKKQNAQVMEMETNKEILRIPVEDKDTPNTPGSRAVFKILKGNEEGNYKIETDRVTNEGVLTVIKGKDYERTTLTELEIGVENEEPLFVCDNWKPVNPVLKDLKVEDTAKIGVKVIDVNDPPVFKNKLQRIFKVEEEDPGEVLYTPVVTDEDSDPSKIRYELVEDPAKWMSIDPKTGKISLVKKMDRESPHVRNSTYTVVMRAIDDGEPPATGTGTLVIDLSDKNDNMPHLVSGTSVMCGNKDDRVRVIAEDADVFPYGGPFTCSFGKEDEELLSTWKLDMNTKSENLLISRRTLPYGKYTVPLKIVDLQGGVGYDVLHVVVCNCGEGDNCLKSLPRTSNLNGAAIGILLGALLLIAVLLCFCFLCECREKKNFMPYMQCDGNQTLIKYNDEGRGSICKADPQLLHSPVSSIGTLKTDQKSPINHLVNTRTGSIQAGLTLQNLKMEKGSHVVATPRQDARPSPKSNEFMVILAELSNGVKRPNGSRNFYSMSTSGLNRSISVNMEHLLEMKLSKLSQDQEDLPEYHPQNYSSEGPNGSTVSLERLSFHMSGSHLDLVQNLGPSFSTLDNVCRQALKEKNIKL